MGEPTLALHKNVFIKNISSSSIKDSTKFLIILYFHFMEWIFILCSRLNLWPQTPHGNIISSVILWPCLMRFALLLNLLSHCSQENIFSLCLSFLIWIVRSFLDLKISPQSGHSRDSSEWCVLWWWFKDVFNLKVFPSMSQWISLLIQPVSTHSLSLKKEEWFKD